MKNSLAFILIFCIQNSLAQKSERLTRKSERLSKKSEKLLKKSNELAEKSTKLPVKKSKNYALVINGGHSVWANNLRYFNNSKYMIEAYHDRGIPLQNIVTLYADGDLQSTNHSFSNEEEKKIFLSESNLFSNKGFTIQGKANKENIKKHLKELGEKIPKGGSLQLFVTDHGSDSNGGSINLWGETLSADEFSTILEETIPEDITVNVNTNICYGGSLTKMTRKNVCVVANQVASTPSYSESISLDRWGQNFPYALKNKLDMDGDKKSTFWDAFLYSKELRNNKNKPYTSLDYILDQFPYSKRLVNYKLDEINNSEKDCVHCEKKLQGHPLSRSISKLEDITAKLDHTSEIERMLKGIKKIGRKRKISASLLKQIKELRNEQNSERKKLLLEQAQRIQKEILQKKKEWEESSEEQKKLDIYTVTNDVERLNNSLEDINSELREFKKKNKYIYNELGLLLTGDDEDIDQLINTRRCLKYEL